VCGRHWSGNAVQVTGKVGEFVAGRTAGSVEVR